MAKNKQQKLNKSAAVSPAAPAPATPVALPEAPAPRTAFFTPEDWITALVTFLIAGAVFLYYMSPSITLQDSGELVTGAYNFGVPHPPGYPLWAFFGFVWRHLVPIGNPAYRICLMSVLTGALVVGVVTLLMTRSILMLLRAIPWGDDVEESLKHWIALTVGACVSLCFGFNRGVWLWASVPEMRVLNVFMFILTACTFFAWMMRPERHAYLYATILVYGFGISNHQTIFVMVVPFMVGVFAVEWFQMQATGGLKKDSFRTCLELISAILISAAMWSFVMAWAGMKHLREFMPVPVVGTMKLGSAAWLFFLSGLALLGVGVKEGWLSWKRTLIGTAVFLIGAGFYAYMPVASATNPPMNWGYSATKAGFLHHITRGQYEKLHIAAPLSRDFFIQIQLFTSALINQYSLGLALFGLLPLAALLGLWKQIKSRGRSWLLFVWAAFAITSLGLLMIINPGLDKQQQEINIKFFAPAHGFYTMLIGYGFVLLIAAAMSRWRHPPQLGLAVRIGCVLLLVLPIIPFQRNWKICENRGHDFGYQFGYRMFRPGGDYPDMDRDAVLYGGTDPGRFVPTYMIFCESFAKQKFADAHFDPQGGATFDRRDVYIITQNALADNTYMSYIRDHYDYTRPDANNPATLADKPAWQQALFKWTWHALDRQGTYPKAPIAIPSERDLQMAFQQYVQSIQNRQLGPEEQVEIVGGQVQVKGVAGVMAINGILTKWIHDRNKDKHSFYVEESYVIPWMYPYLEPFGIIMKINKDPLPAREQDPALWQKIVSRDTAYWNNLIADFRARSEFKRDSDAQKTFSKLRSAIGGLYAARKMYNEAVFAFTQAQQLCPDSPEANFRLAQLYMEVGKFSEAVKTLEDYQQRDPLNRKIGEAINQLKNIQGQSSQIQQLEAMLAGQPRNVGLVVQLAQVRGRIGQMDRVIPLCESFLAQTNLSANDMLQIAQIYLSLNQADRCLATLQRILQQYPQESQAYYAVALIRAAQNMQSESLDALEKAISLAPTLRDVARNDAFPQPGQPGRLVNLRANPRFQRIIGLPPGGVPTQAPAPLFQ